MYKNTVVDKLNEVKAYANEKAIRARDMIVTARRSHLVAELHMENIINFIKHDVDNNTLKKVENYITNGHGNLQAILNEVETYYEVEGKLKCFRELK